MYPIAKTDFDISFPYLGCFCKGFERIIDLVGSCTKRDGGEAGRGKAGGKHGSREQELSSVDIGVVDVEPDAQKEPIHGPESLALKLAEQKKKKTSGQLHEDANKDPYVELGFGLIAYRNLMETLIVGFLLLSCIIAPAAMIYRRGRAFGESDITAYGKWSLGNLGYSTVQC